MLQKVKIFIFYVILNSLEGGGRDGIFCLRGGRFLVSIFVLVWRLFIDIVLFFFKVAQCTQRFLFLYQYPLSFELIRVIDMCDWNPHYATMQKFLTDIYFAFIWNMGLSIILQASTKLYRVECPNFGHPALTSF